MRWGQSVCSRSKEQSEQDFERKLSGTHLSGMGAKHRDKVFGLIRRPKHDLLP